MVASGSASKHEGRAEEHQKDCGRFRNEGQSPQTFKKMALVAPTGIKPPTGEIFDMFLVVAREYLEESFLDTDATPEYPIAYPLEPTPEQIEI